MYKIIIKIALVDLGQVPKAEGAGGILRLSKGNLTYATF
jgi:hypothetical protein